VRRCRPLLGTFVEITVPGEMDAVTNEAIQDAFQAIEKVQKLLNLHDQDSELSLLNREAARCPVRVSRETYKLIHCADRLAEESGGAFDYTVAPTLARWGILPEQLKRNAVGSWRDILFLRDYQIYFLQPLALDLGGIAKGYAVDKAIEALQKCGVSSAVVNAGGDLRVFGDQPSRVHLRHPADPQSFLGCLDVSDGSLATSAPSFSECEWNGKRVSHLVNPRSQDPVIGPISVSVKAKECWLADALTKVVLNAPDEACKMLAKYNAEAFVFQA
jgi:thiamine biosynthesis lipoprotein